MSVVAFIPARGGSKGVPNKNIKSLAGKPLIAWSIEQARNSELIDRVIVSTDSERIADIARAHGAEVPFLRPPEISGDEATTESAMLHCCEFLRKKDKELPAIFVLVQCTSPLRREFVFDRAIRDFKEKGYDSMLSVSESHRFTWKNPQCPQASYDFKKRPRRQDIKADSIEFLETGSFYLTKTNLLLKEKNRLCGKIGFSVTSEAESFEIDSSVDFTICEELMKAHGMSARIWLGEC